MLQLPVVKAACCEVIQESLSEHTVPQALQTADRCAWHTQLGTLYP